jgi:hypothetical protein
MKNISLVRAKSTLLKILYFYFSFCIVNEHVSYSWHFDEQSFIQGDQKVSVHLMITIQSFLPHYLAQSDCLAAYRQSHGDTRLTLTPSVILNSNYVIMVSG